MTDNEIKYKSSICLGNTLIEKNFGIYYLILLILATEEKDRGIIDKNVMQLLKNLKTVKKEKKLFIPRIKKMREELLDVIYKTFPKAQNTFGFVKLLESFIEERNLLVKEELEKEKIQQRIEFREYSTITQEFKDYIDECKNSTRIQELIQDPTEIVDVYEDAIKVRNIYFLLSLVFSTYTKLLKPYAVLELEAKKLKEHIFFYVMQPFL